MKVLGAKGFSVLRKPRRLCSLPMYDVPVYLLSDKAFLRVHGNGHPLDRSKVIHKTRTKETIRISETVGGATTDDSGFPMILLRKLKWKKLTLKERKAILYHERLHILLGHAGYRFWLYYQRVFKHKRHVPLHVLEEWVRGSSPKWVNKAAYGKEGKPLLKFEAE